MQSLNGDGHNGRSHSSNRNKAPLIPCARSWHASEQYKSHRGKPSCRWQTPKPRNSQASCNQTRPSKSRQPFCLKKLAKRRSLRRHISTSSQRRLHAQHARAASSQDPIDAACHLDNARSVKVAGRAYGRRHAKKIPPSIIKARYRHCLEVSDTLTAPTTRESTIVERVPTVSLCK